MSVSKRLRYEVLRRDNHACRYCGATAPDVKLTVDHVVPTALGGSDAPDNLVAACIDCNSGKSATPPGASLVADVRADALRWAKAQYVVSEARAALAQDRARWREAFFDTWLLHNDDEDASATWEDTADQMYSVGLSLDDVAEASRATARTWRRDPWRYFCGACWRMAADIREATAAVMEADDAP